MHAVRGKTGLMIAAKVIEVPLERIETGARRREVYGDISGLAKGIARVGQLSPILVSENGGGKYRLVYGGRRLKAVTSLGWPTIRALVREHISEEELRDIELEENINRKDLTEQERHRTFALSKKVAEQAQTAKEVLSRVDKTPNPKGGRPPKEDVPERVVAEALGASRQGVRRAEQHVSLAERYPFMQGKGWRQSNVLAVGEELEHIPKAEQDKVMDVLSCARLMDPALALKLIGNMARKPESERKEIYKLSQSKREVDVTLALTRAAELPPMPDPRINYIGRALEALRDACATVPDDTLWNPRITAVMGELKAIRTAIRKPTAGVVIQ